ncbi:MAG: NADH-quinone oxidoreductase subunit N [Anaerolineaceae bacterium]|nr:NADH-quinone oxidoreductase subunit N [Anaerolineaceae bacterium]
MTQSDLIAILPILVVVGWALVCLILDLWIPVGRKGITAFLTALGLVAALVIVVVQRGQTALAFNGMAVQDGFSMFLDIIFLVSGLAGIALAVDYLKRMNIERGEYYILLMFTVSGMMLMAHANDLIMVFISLELLSIPLYVLAGFARPRPESEEASLKYFLLGTFASAIVLYGVALIFGATSHTDFKGILNAVLGSKVNPVLFLAGSGILLVGFGFKIAAVPFHMWTPDVYQGAPSPVSGFMSVGAKAAGFAALLRVFALIFPSLAVNLTPVLWILAALTMILGNVLAVVQTNIKRLLAYSSIANAGYILMAFVPYGQAHVLNDSIASALFYLSAYAFTSLGAWAVVIALERAEGKGLLLDDYAGLGKKHPWLSLSMMIFMLSFTGVPLTLGFWGKFYLFRTALEGGYTILALIGLLTSLVSAYYYLRVVVIMYMRPGDPEVQGGAWINFTAIAAALAVVGLSFVPGPLFDMAAAAILKLQ